MCDTGGPYVFNNCVKHGLHAECREEHDFGVVTDRRDAEANEAGDVEHGEDGHDVASIRGVDLPELECLCY